MFFTLNEVFTSYFQRGYFVDFTLYYDLVRDWDVALSLWVFMIACECLIWAITRWTIRNVIPYPIGSAIFATTLSIMFLFPLITSYAKNFSYLMAGATAIQCAVQSMKIYSYWSTSWMIERGYIKEDLSDQNTEGGEKKQPLNQKHLSFKHFVFYIAAPTLVYEAKWPKSNKIRWGYAAFLFVQMWASFFIIYLLCMLIIPVLVLC